MVCKLPGVPLLEPEPTLLLPDAAGAAERDLGHWGAEVRADRKGAGLMEPPGAALSSSQPSRTQGAFSTNEHLESSAGPWSQEPAACLPPPLHSLPRTVSPAQGSSHLQVGTLRPSKAHWCHRVRTLPSRCPPEHHEGFQASPLTAHQVLRCATERCAGGTGVSRLRTSERVARGSSVTWMEKLRPMAGRGLAEVVGTTRSQAMQGPRPKVT